MVKISLANIPRYTEYRVNSKLCSGDKLKEGTYPRALTLITVRKRLKVDGKKVRAWACCNKRGLIPVRQKHRVASACNKLM